MGGKHRQQGWATAKIARLDGQDHKMQQMNRAQRTGQKEYSAFPPAPMEFAAEEENLFEHWIWAIPSTATGTASLDCIVVTTVCYIACSRKHAAFGSRWQALCCILSPPGAARKSAAARALPRARSKAEKERVILTSANTQACQAE